MIGRTLGLLVLAVAGPGVAGDGLRGLGCDPHEPPEPPPPPVVIRLATAFAPGHILTDAAERFKANVEGASKGRITVQVMPSLATEDEVNLRTSRGEVDMQLTGGPPLQAFAPQYFFFNGPYVIRDYAHFQRVWAGELGDEARALIERNGNMVALGTVYRGFRQFTSNKPITGPADLVGLKLRLPNVPTWVAVWTQLGTSPVQFPLGEIYNALATGAADASEGDLSQISSLKLFEVQSHLSLTNHLVGVGWAFVNNTFYQGLHRRQRRLVDGAMKEATEWATARMRAGETDLLASLQAAGMTIVVPDADAIREKARPAVDELFRTAWPVTTWEEVLAQ